MDTNESLAWLAGLLEGEASFTWRHNVGRKYGWPVITLHMTDRDVVTRAAKIMGAKSIGDYQPKQATRKKLYTCRVYCGKAASIMEAILPYMGERRTAKINELLAMWERRPGRAGRWEAMREAKCAASLAA